jgi:hypothetical protein
VKIFHESPKLLAILTRIQSRFRGMIVRQKFKSIKPKTNYLLENQSTNNRYTQVESSKIVKKYIIFLNRLIKK